jgi:hypothetical protein
VARADEASQPVPDIDLGFIDTRMRLMRRWAWTQELPRPWRLNLATGFDRITVHHSGASPIYHTNPETVARDLDGVYTSHKKRCYGDIGYHFIIDYGGCAWEGRSLAYEGAHVTDANARNIGIMVFGNFERQCPSQLQLAALDQMVCLLEEHFAIGASAVYGHRDLGHSVCPGENLYPHVAKLRA